MFRDMVKSDKYNGFLRKFDAVMRDFNAKSS